MRKRTRSREFALQILYQLDLSSRPLEEALEDFWLDRVDLLLSNTEKLAAEKDKKEPDVREYANKLVRGIFNDHEKLDKIIESFAENWKIDRMSYVDRNILRLATYEMINFQDVPIKVAINEAVDLAKRYGEDDSSKFVNGILDKIAKTECKR